MDVFCKMRGYFSFSFNGKAQSIIIHSQEIVLAFFIFITDMKKGINL